MWWKQHQNLLIFRISLFKHMVLEESKFINYKFQYFLDIYTQFQWSFLYTSHFFHFGFLNLNRWIWFQRLEILQINYSKLKNDIKINICTCADWRFNRCLPGMHGLVASWKFCPCIVTSFRNIRGIDRVFLDHFLQPVNNLRVTAQHPFHQVCRIQIFNVNRSNIDLISLLRQIQNINRPTQKRVELLGLFVADQSVLVAN